MNGDEKVRELKIRLLERELARLRRSLAFLEREIQECAGELREVQNERAAADTRRPLINARPSSELIQSAWFDMLSDDAYLRMANLVRTPSRPNAEVLLPFAAATLWRMVSDGRFPKPEKLSERITAWRVRDIRNWLCTRRG